MYLRARDAQVDAVRTELLQLARVTAAQMDGDLLKTLVSPAQKGSPEHLQLLAIGRFGKQQHSAAVEQRLLRRILRRHREAEEH